MMRDAIPDTEDTPEEQRKHGDEILRKVRALNQRDFLRGVQRDRSSRSYAEIRAAYEQAMKEKRGEKP